MAVVWKEDSERQPQLITPENEGGDETSSPSPPRFICFDDPDVPLGPCPRGPPEPPRGLFPGQIRLDFHQDCLQLYGLQLLHLLVREKE